jgi:O-antigen/teichoic acid export membrane protein
MFLNITLWLCIVVAVLMSALAYWCVTLTFGMTYIAAVIPLQILAFKVIAVALNIISGQILIIDEQQKYFVLRSISGCIICIVLNLMVIPRYGIEGVAAVAIITQLVAGFLIHAIIPRYRYMFKMQLRALAFGWKDVRRLKEIANNRKMS